MKITDLIFKEQKPNFTNNQRSRLINPSKTEMGFISKKYLLFRSN